MKNFIEKWNNEPRYKTKIKLGLYTLFVVIVSLFAISSNRSSINNTLDMDYNDTNGETNETETITIELPEKYKYTKTITINQKNYQYTGIKDSQKESITKNIDGIKSNYAYENSNYYKEEFGTYTLTTKEEVYDMIGYNYLKPDTINAYLSKSTKEEEKYLVYLKDIILGNDSEEYITIKLNGNNINIDYTSLMKIFDNTVESYIYDVVIEEIE